MKQTADDELVNDFGVFFCSFFCTYYMTNEIHTFVVLFGTYQISYGLGIGLIGTFCITTQECLEALGWCDTREDATTATVTTLSTFRFDL